MNTPQNTIINIPVRQTAVNGLAVVGFIALIIAGISLAVYSTRFVPTVVNRVGSAAVYLGSVFNSAPDPTLSVVSTPIASTTISFGPAATTTVNSALVVPAASSTETVTAPSNPAPTQNIAVVAPALYGRPDLQITVQTIGYLATNNQLSSFVEKASVPVGKQPAVEFTILNIGTNISGTWQLSSEPKLALPYNEQPSLLPRERRNFIIFLDRMNKPSQSLTISVTSNSVTETNTSNNSIPLTLNLE